MCSDEIQKMGAVVRLSLLHTNYETLGGSRQHQTNLTKSSQKSSHMVGVSTDTMNTGTKPTLTFGPYGCDTWPITNNTMGQSWFHVEVCHYKYDLGEHKKRKKYESE